MPSSTWDRAIVAAVLVLLVHAPASADYGSDVAKAKAEAKLALAAGDTDIIALHVHRAANCLYGRDSYFYERSADPSCDTRVGAVGGATNERQRRRLYEAGTKMLAAVASSLDAQKAHDEIEDAIKMIEAADKPE